MAPAHPQPLLIVTPSHAEWLAILCGLYHGVDLVPSRGRIRLRAAGNELWGIDRAVLLCSRVAALVPWGVVFRVTHSDPEWWWVVGLVSLSGRRLAFLFLLYFFVFCNTMV